jgi:hypothetical protein
MHKLKNRVCQNIVEPLEQRRLLTIKPSLIEVAISAAAKAADPALNNFRCFDLRVTVIDSPVPTKWGAADVHVELTKGQFYGPGDGFDQAFPQKALWNSHPNLQYDTFIAAQNFAAPVIFGSSWAGTANQEVFTNTQLDAAYGPTPGNAPGAGTYTIARLTISADAAGAAVGRVLHTADSTDITYFGFALPLVVGQATLMGGLFWDKTNTGNIGSGPVTTGELPGTVYADDNNNGVLDPGEPSGKTYGEQRLLIFPGLTPGAHRIRQAPIGAFGVSAPAGNFIDMTTSANQTINTIRFGNYAPGVGGVSVSIGNDKNGDGLWNDDYVSWMRGPTLYLDLNKNHVPDANEPLAAWGGIYGIIAGVPVGQYTLRQIVPADQAITSPGGDSINVNITGSFLAGASYLNHFTFANSPTVYGMVFRDANDNGIREADELGVPNATVYVDLNSSRRFDEGDLSTQTAADGSYIIENVSADWAYVSWIAPRGYKTSTKTAAFWRVNFSQPIATRWSFAVVPLSALFTAYDAPPSNVQSLDVLPSLDEPLFPSGDLLA